MERLIILLPFLHGNRYLWMNKRKGMSFTEVIVTVAILATMAAIAVPSLLPKLKEFSVRDNALRVAAMINEARSLAIKKSEVIYIDFSQATSNHGEQGGLVQIAYNDGTVISQTYLDKNIRLNTTQSTISNQEITFDFKGRPTDDTGNYLNFSSSNNKVAISFFKQNGSPVTTRTMKISPITGKLSEN